MVRGEESIRNLASLNVHQCEDDRPRGLGARSCDADREESQESRTGDPSPRRVGRAKAERKGKLEEKDEEDRRAGEVGERGVGRPRSVDGERTTRGRPEGRGMYELYASRGGRVATSQKRDERKETETVADD